MKLLNASVLSLTALLFTGCAATVGSDVTVFHDWPTDLPSKTYVFTYPEGQDVDLEYRNYQKMLVNELRGLGFVQAENSSNAALKVSMEYKAVLEGVTVATVAQSFPDYSMSLYVRPYSGRWRGPGYRGHFYSPYWYAPVPFYEYQETEFPFYHRRLQVNIAKAAGDKPIYEVTVDNVGRQASLAYAMPYMIRSAFTEFPGKSGQPHHVNIKIDEQQAIK